MAEYIKRSDAMKVCQDYSSHCFTTNDASGQDIADRIENDIVEIPTADVVHIDEVFRLIAGHSNYHGDDILAALKCVTEGKEVNPVKPLSADVVKVVRCKDCNFYIKSKQFGKDWCNKHAMNVKPTDFCSCGERRKDNDL